MVGLPNQFQNLESLFQHVFRFYKQILWKVLPFSCAVSALILLPFIIWEHSEPSQHLLLQFLKLDKKHLLLSTGFWIVAFWLLLSLTDRMYSLLHGIPKTHAQSFMTAFTHLVPILIIQCLYVFVIISGSIFLIIPGVVFSISCMFAFILYLIGRTTLFHSLVLSHRLVWGQWWRTAITLLLPVLINLMVSLLAYMLIAQLESIRSFSWTLILIQSFFIPYLLSTILILLYDLESR